jgi:hypothetical protein
MKTILIAPCQTKTPLLNVSEVFELIRRLMGVIIQLGKSGFARREDRQHPLLTILIWVTDHEQPALEHLDRNRDSALDRPPCAFSEVLRHIMKELTMTARLILLVLRKPRDLVGIERRKVSWMSSGSVVVERRDEEGVIDSAGVGEVAQEPSERSPGRVDAAPSPKPARIDREGPSSDALEAPLVEEIIVIVLGNDVEKAHWLTPRPTRDPTDGA